MENDIIKGLYKEYLSMVLDIKEIDKEKRTEPDYYYKEQRFTVRKNSEYSQSIIDTKTDREVTIFRNKDVEPVKNCPGIFRVTYKDLFENLKAYYCDIYGRKVSLIKEKYRDEESPYAISRGKKENANYFFNDVTGTYEPLKYKPLTMKYSYDYGPYGDYSKDVIVPLQTKDVILFISDDEDKLIVYRKATNTYEEFKIEKKYEPYYYYGQLQKLSIDINADLNIVLVGASYFYITPFMVVDITHIIEDSKYRLEYITVEPITDHLLSYSEFESKIKSNKNFMAEISEAVKKQKKEKYEKELEESKKLKEQEERLKLLQRKKELLQSIFESLKELESVNRKLNTNIDEEKISIEKDILLINVGDHKEINPTFLNYLKYIDLSYISFKNVKVSGIDFSGTNAFINPQEVYNKDMSNGIYDGLDFTIANFNGVNIKGSSFDKCNMDFAILDNVIMDETTILPNKKSVKK